MYKKTIAYLLLILTIFISCKKDEIITRHTHDIIINTHEKKLTINNNEYPLDNIEKTNLSPELITLQENRIEFHFFNHKNIKEKKNAYRLKKEIKRFSIDTLTLTENMSYRQTIKLLKQQNINFKTWNDKGYIILLPENHKIDSITFWKRYKQTPESITIKKNTTPTS